MAPQRGQRGAKAGTVGSSSTRLVFRASPLFFISFHLQLPAALWAGKGDALLRPHGLVVHRAAAGRTPELDHSNTQTRAEYHSRQNAQPQKQRRLQRQHQARRQQRNSRRRKAPENQLPALLNHLLLHGNLPFLFFPALRPGHLHQLAQAVVERGFGDGRFAQLRKLGQGELRVGHPQIHRLLELVGQLLQHAALLQPVDGLDLPLGGVHRLVQIGAVAVEAAVDAVAQVVRCFEDGNITHVEGSINPLRDIEIINTELCLADMETVEKRQERLVKLLKTGDKKVPVEKAVLDKVMEGLGEAVPARRLGLTDEEKEFLTELHLLTMKPVLYVANVAEDEVAAPENNPHVQAVMKYAEEEGAETIVVSAKMESEIAELPEDEAKEFLEMAGLEEAGLDRLIKAGFKLLGLMTYLTAGETESRAWTIKRGTKAPQAAGKIHSDFERGFIRAEIVSYDDLVACGSKAAARDKGLVRLEGKDYVMQDGDVVEFRFNV